MVIIWDLVGGAKKDQGVVRWAVEWGLGIVIVRVYSVTFGEYSLDRGIVDQGLRMRGLCMGGVSMKNQRNQPLKTNFASSTGRVICSIFICKSAVVSMCSYVTNLC